MSEQLSTRRCDTPLLQAFVDNRTILVKIAARITGCRSRAEDVVQDAFFRLQSAPQITSSFKAQLSYLFQIVRNLAIDHYRKQALEQKYSGPEEEGLNVVIQGASPETSHINYATLEHIADALTELPKRTRYAFEMYRLHGVPQKDIAKELGVSPTLVNFMIRDALVHCRKVTAERQGDNVTHLSARRWRRRAFLSAGSGAPTPPAPRPWRRNGFPAATAPRACGENRRVGRSSGKGPARFRSAPFPALASAAQRDRPGRNGGPAPPTTPPPAPALPAPAAQGRKASPWDRHAGAPPR